MSNISFYKPFLAENYHKNAHLIFAAQSSPSEFKSLIYSNGDLKRATWLHRTVTYIIDFFTNGDASKKSAHLVASAITNTLDILRRHLKDFKEWNDRKKFKILDLENATKVSKRKSFTLPENYAEIREQLRHQICTFSPNRPMHKGGNRAEPYNELEKGLKEIKQYKLLLAESNHDDDAKILINNILDQVKEINKLYDSIVLKDPGLKYHGFFTIPHSKLPLYPQWQIV